MNIPEKTIKIFQTTFQRNFFQGRTKQRQAWTSQSQESSQRRMTLSLSLLLCLHLQEGRTRDLLGQYQVADYARPT